MGVRTMSLLHETENIDEGEVDEGLPQLPLTQDELLQVRQFLRDFAVIRATCPMALRSLSRRR